MSFCEVEDQNMSVNDESELQSFYEKIQHSPGMRGAPMREQLFKYLWRHRNEKTSGEDIWEKVWLYTHDYSEATVRYHCSVLAHVLRDYCGLVFSEETKSLALRGIPRSGWIVDLPEGGPQRGYQLQLRKVNDPSSLRRAFWSPHLESQREICIVYVEQLFFHKWHDRSVFRYYDCNTKRSAEDIRTQLQAQGGSDKHLLLFIHMQHGGSSRQKT